MDAAAMTDTRDHTPVTVVLPAYALKPVLDALKWRAIRLRTRSALRPAPVGHEASLDRLIAGTLDEVAAVIAEARDQN